MRASICLTGNPPATVADFLREKIMGTQSSVEGIYFAGFILNVLDISNELRYTQEFMSERSIVEVGKYDAYVNPFNLTTMVTVDCSFYSLFYRHFLPIVEMIALELSKHFSTYALVSIDGSDEQYCLYNKGVLVIISPANNV